MFLGRSTLQWTGLISSAVAALQIIIPTIAPDMDPTATTTILGTIGIFLGALIAFVANTYTTPIASPQVPSGTEVTVVTPGTTPNTTVTV